MFFLTCARHLFCFSFLVSSALLGPSIPHLYPIANWPISFPCKRILLHALKDIRKKLFSTCTRNILFISVLRFFCARFVQNEDVFCCFLIAKCVICPRKCAICPSISPRHSVPLWQRRPNMHSALCELPISILDTLSHG